MVEGTVVIAGATGSNVTRVNGPYIPTGHGYVHNAYGRELLRKEGDHDWWLRYTTRKYWMVRITSDKDANNCNGWMQSEVGVADSALASRWTIWDGSVWEEQGSVTIARGLQRVMIEGATGSRAVTRINRSYIPIGQVHNGRELLRKEAEVTKTSGSDTRHANIGC